MQSMTLHPAEPDRDFGQLAQLFTSEQDEPTTEAGLREDYEQHKSRIFRLMVAEDGQGGLLGFNWGTRSRTDAAEAYIYVIVKPDQRGRGVGGRLYADLEASARADGLKKLETSLRDDCPPFLAFAESHGFSQQRHSIGMALDLEALDDRPYDALIAGLQAQGFQFTSMQALGDTPEAQRRLYTLNDMTASETPGSEGHHPWPSFEDFQRSVCRAGWYRPAGQMVVIDTASGEWVALSAITRFEGADHAYNLHTGVDKRYRGRKLAQAVKVLALRYARANLGVGTVRTHHNSGNLPMIAIDRKLGYVQIGGLFHMQKVIA